MILTVFDQCFACFECFACFGPHYNLQLKGSILAHVFGEYQMKMKSTSKLVISNKTIQWSYKIIATEMKGD